MKINLRKGLDIRLLGEASDSSAINIDSLVYAVIPDDYPGLSAKVDVHEGDELRVGSRIIHDKKYPEICLVSPVSGRVKAVVRGERRKVLRIEIESDGKMTQLWQSRKDSPLDTIPAKSVLCRAGIFAQIRRRPFDVIARPDVRPRDIFVTAFDSSPLAPSLAKLIGKEGNSLINAAVKTLKTLTDGKIYICKRPWDEIGDVEGAEIVDISGPHPAGNPGIQIANIAPVNKGEEVWTIDIMTLCRIGRLVRDAVIDTTVTVALTGPEVESPCMIRTVEGAAIASLLEKRIKKSNHNIRVVSGNVLSGVAVDPREGFLRFPWHQITVIAEGDDKDEFMGWASMSPKKLSFSATFPLSRLAKRFSPDARLCGGRRAMILSGEYDRVMPADIMVEYLIKAIISHNIEEMEALGIYEIAPEDVALCEFVDTSKLPIQQIVRDGLDFLRKETE